MNKTISITIGGQLFHIEEDGYHRLDAYLRSIRDHFSTFEGHEEIVADIEARIAEHFQERLTGKQVLSASDVEELIKKMGTVTDFAEFSEEQKQEQSEQPKRRKKLYRDVDDRVLGGVAAGLAAYFGIDPTLMRLIFVIAAISGGWGIAVYIILWLVTPEAVTPAEKAEMRGEPMTLSSIEQKIRSAMPKSGKKKVVEAPLNAMSRLFEALAQVISRIVPLLARIIGFIVSAGASLALFGLTFGFVTMLVNADSPYVDFPLRDIVTPMVFYTVGIAALIAVFIPLLFVLLLGSSLLKGKSVFSTASVGSLIALWLTSLMVGGVTAFSVAPEYREKYLAQEATRVENTKSYAFDGFNKIAASDGVTLTIHRADTYDVQVRGDADDIENTRVELKDGMLAVSRKPVSTHWRMCLFCFRDHRVTVDVSMPTISTVSADGAVRTNIDGFALETLTLAVRNGSRMDISSAVTNLQATVTGASRLSGDGELDSADLSVSNGSRIQWSGSIAKITTTINGASRVDLDGNGSILQAKVTNGSTLNAADFVADDVAITTEGASRAEVTAKKSLSAKARNGSVIHYTDTGVAPQTETSGASRIDQR